MEVLYDVLWQTCFSESSGYLLNDCWSLWRGLKDNSISSQNSGDQAVNEDQVWVLMVEVTGISKIVIKRYK